MPSKMFRSACLCALGWTALSVFAAAQSPNQPPAQPQPGTQPDARTPAPPHPSPEPNASPGLSEAPDIAAISPAVRGFNAGITFAGVHDSVVGWSTLATPAVGYTFNDVFSVDASIPIYMYRLAESRSAHPRPNQLLVNQRGELGDFILDFHAQFLPGFAQYRIDAAVTAPTGDEAYGLTTGRCTFDFNNVFQRTYGRLTPTLEIGGGDSSTLVNREVNKNYTSLGPLSHFQLGLAIELFHGATFESDAYEQLPIGDQKIYGPSRNGKATVVTGHSVTEDNGFTNSLDIPIDRNFSVSGYYSRSLRLHYDTVAFGVTYVLRAPPPQPEASFDNLFR